MTELTEEELKYASEEDIVFFNKITEGLPTMAGKNGDGKDKNGEYIPYGSGPHIIKHFKEAIEISKPRAILEIGFNCGVGAALLLALSDAFVYSVEKSDREETHLAGAILQERSKVRSEVFLGGHAHRFCYVVADSKEVYKYLGGMNFQLAWIDGGHEEPDVTADIELCKQLKIPYLLFDDIMPKFGPGVLPAIEKFPELELVKDMNNLRLYRVNY